MDRPHDSLFLQRKDRGDASRGEYGLVNSTTVDTHDDDENDEDDAEEEFRKDAASNMEAFELEQGLTPSSSSSSSSPWCCQRILFTPMFPDDRFDCCGATLFDGVQAVRCFKFNVITWVALIAMYYFVRWMDLENDHNYTIPDMILHESNPIMVDTMFFFVVGRLYKQRGIDHIAWISTMIASGLFASMETYFPFLQHSFTLYSIHCLWPWELWAFVVGLVTLCSALGILHVRTIIQQEIVGIKVFEITLCILIFLLPPMSSPYFHFHHWFAGWLLGMHCNLDVWWSRLTMAWCWGAYINGIAVYGRDPLLTCGYAFYLSWSNRCPYLQCYLDEMKNHTHSGYQIMEVQDWRNCSASDYLP